VLSPWFGRRILLRRHELGLIDARQWQRFQTKQSNIATEKARLLNTRVQPDSPVALAVSAISDQNVPTVRSLMHQAERPRCIRRSHQLCSFLIL
jgi:tRNA uridine 5-carboxymethylaminomethyl modification enzyme